MSLQSRYSNLILSTRGRQRYRKAVLSFGSSAIAKAVSLLTGVVSIPLTVRYLGSEQYGLWIAISSTLSLMAFADLGLGNGLVNAVATAVGKDDTEMERRYIASAFYMLLGLSISFALPMLLLASEIPWHLLFNAPLYLQHDTSICMLIVFGNFCASLPLGVVQRVQAGHQEAYRTNLWNMGASIVSLGVLFLAVRFSAPLPWLVACMSIPQILAQLLNWCDLFLLRRPDLIPKWSHANLASSRYLLRIGVMFFTLQLAVTMAYTADNLLVARLFGIEAVTDYAVPYRLFAYVSLIIGLMLAPLWPAYSEAIARGDTEWVQRTLYASLYITFIVACTGSTLLACFGSTLISAWVGDQVNVTRSLILGLALWTIIGSTGNAMAMYLNGAGLIRFQVKCALLVGIGSIGLSIVMAHWLGLPGIIWGTAIAYICFAIAPYSWLLYRLQIAGFDLDLLQANSTTKRISRRRAEKE